MPKTTRLGPSSAWEVTAEPGPELVSLPQPKAKVKHVKVAPQPVPEPEVVVSEPVSHVETAAEPEPEVQVSEPVKRARQVTPAVIVVP